MREMQQAPEVSDPPGADEAAPTSVPSKHPLKAGAMRFRILGPLEVAQGRELISLGGPKQRAVLAHLLVHVNELVAADTLIDEIWGDGAQETVRNTLYTYVSNLRRTLGHDRIQSQTPGYRLRAEPSELDAARFHELLASAAMARAIDPRIASTILEEALGIWRGAALADVAVDGALLAEASRLDELRLVASEERIDALLAIGEQARVIAEAEALVDRHPLRERIWQQLMLALYRERRQGDSLNAYQRIREILADELGIDPSPELVRLHDRILQQDPSLELRGEPLRGYRLLEKIDEGPTGVVFRAIQPHVGREVAIKVFHEQLASDPAFVRRFEREAQAMASLEHPHIVPVYDYWREFDRAYVVSRYLKGGSLASLETRGEPLEHDRALAIVEQIATALAFAHGRQIAHGNVNASNVLFDGEGNAYLGDFRLGVGPLPDRSDDVSALVSLVQDLLGTDVSGALGDLVQRATGGMDIPNVDEMLAAIRVETPSQLAPASPGADVRNPYKGLRAFTEADAADYFGRSELIARLLAGLGTTGGGARFVAVVGPSGAGKSSAVRGGLLPAIRRGALGDPERVFVAEMFPGAHPLDELEGALLRVSTNQTPRLHALFDGVSRGLLHAMDLVLPAPAELVLVVDQFEELFTLTTGERERELFLESLRVAIADPESRLRVIVTLRADFYDRPLVYPRIGELLAAGTQVVSPLTPDETEQAIRRPAEGVGITVEPGLAAAIVADLAHQPGALPLLQYALTELFERRDVDQLTLAAYREIGGVAGALSKRAEQLFAATDPEVQRTIRQVFLRLVTIGDGREDTRRRVVRSELDALEVDTGIVDTVVDTFGRHRLLTFDREPTTREPTVEIAHEALLGAWSRLRTWIDDARDDLRQDRRLARAAGEWRGSSRDPSFLLRGAQLEQVASWASSTALALGRPQCEYLKASIDERDRGTREEEERRVREERTERRSRSRLRALVAVLSVAALVAGTLTVVATSQRRRADQESARAEGEARAAGARELAAAAVANLEVDPELSVLLAIQAVERTRSLDGSVLPEAEDALHQAIGASRIERTILGVGGAVAWASTGVFASESAAGEGIVEITDPDSGARLLSLEAHEGAVTGLAFSGDGRMLATTGTDGSLNVWDSSSGDLLVRVTHGREASDPAFSADGSLVGAGWTGGNTTAQIARVVTGEVIQRTELPPGPLAFSPNLDRVAVLGRAIVDLETGHRSGSVEGQFAVSWSPNGRYIATGEWSWANVFDAKGRLLYSLEYLGNVDALAWSQDSRRLVTGGNETATVWDIGSARADELVSFSPRLPGAIAGVALSPDGGRVATGDADLTAVKIWDVSDAGDAEVANIPAAFWSSDVAFMPDGTHVARLVGSGPAIALWDLEGGRTVQRFGPTLDELWGPFHPQIEVSRDGTSVAAFGSGASVWDVATGTMMFEVPRGQEISAIDWSTDGKHLILASLQGWAKIVDRNGREVTTLREDEGYRVSSARFSPDGRSVVLGGVPNGKVPDLGSRVTIWDLTRGEKVRTIDVGGNAEDIWFTFFPDGRRLAIMSSVGPAEVWDVEVGTRVTVLGEQTASVAFSPDGTRIAAALGDSTIRVYDAISFEQLLVLRGHEGGVAWLGFSPDGSMLVSGAEDDVVRVWALDIGRLLVIARQNVTRALTDDECYRYLHVDLCPDT